MTDEELYRRYLHGDEAGLSALMDRYGSALTLYIDGYLGDIHEAEDLMIEVFSYLLAKRPRIREGCFKAYLYKAARHAALRHKSRRPAVFSLEDLREEPEGKTLLEEVVKDRERSRILHLCKRAVLRPVVQNGLCIVGADTGQGAQSVCIGCVQFHLRIRCQLLCVRQCLRRLRLQRHCKPERQHSTDPCGGKTQQQEQLLAAFFVLHRLLLPFYLIFC